MQRDIKFRSWNKARKKMADLQESTPLALDTMLNTQLAVRGEGGLFVPFMKDVPIMQYTGLKDKNGVEIYEGDILKAYVSTSENDYYVTGPVKFEDGAFSLTTKDDEWEPHLYELEAIEVIGKIHKNPELLEKL